MRPEVASALLQLARFAAALGIHIVIVEQHETRDVGQASCTALVKQSADHSLARVFCHTQDRGEVAAQRARNR